MAYREQASGHLRKAVVLRGADGQELRAQGNARLRYSVTEDGCSVGPGTALGCELGVMLCSLLRNQTDCGERR